jgi:chromosome transmission fidelity protein 1
MEPTEDFVNFLFPYVEKEQIEKFTCGHIIPSENLEVFVVGKNNTNFEFSFGKRDDAAMINDLGYAILKLSKNIPHGVVLFVPSYKYLSQIMENWKTSGLWEEISRVKKVFSESTSKNILTDYSTHIAKGQGGLLLSVVGGSLSEGINFSDDLARAVMIVGLPYPNAFSGDMIMKKKYIESEVLRKTGDKRLAAETTRNFYENICMRAVNQSVGRSIRHINDYSAIYLFDARYKSSRIQSKLSNWIKDRISHSDNFTEILNSTSDFFHKKTGNGLVKSSF